MTIKLIATDIDGTLVKDNKEISEYTINTLKKAHANGVHIVLCTGRPVSGVQNYLTQLGLTSANDYVITYNGAQVQKVGNNEVLISNTLDYTDFLTLDNLSHQLNIHGQAILPSSDMYVTTPDISYYSVLDSFYTKMPLHYRLQNEIPHTFKPAKYMWADEPHILQRATTGLSPAIKNKYYTVRSEKWFFEFMHPDATKGNATLKLAKMLGIDVSEILTAGDQENDLTLIKTGLGVAMGNAIPKIKSSAQYITDDNNHDGLAKAIEKFVL